MKHNVLHTERPRTTSWPRSRASVSMTEVVCAVPGTSNSLQKKDGVQLSEVVEDGVEEKQRREDTPCLKQPVWDQSVYAYSLK